MSKKLETLVDDIYGLFKGGHVVKEENLQTCLANIGANIKKSLFEANNKERRNLRMSSIGTPDRKLWFLHNLPMEQQEVFNGPTNIKFMYGHIVEELVLLLAKEAGHLVEGQQDTLTIDGVEGHRDARIDGVTVDVKTASKWSFQKFEKATLFNDDPFGYIAQISAYMEAEGDKRGAFVAINKESGEIVVLMVDEDRKIDAAKRIQEVKEVVALKEPPYKPCYEPVPFGGSGNMVLNKNCGFCAFKDICWAGANGGQGLRKFQYAGKIEEFVFVGKEPKVEEIR